MFLLE